jgi:excisionase family DNA binding protein
VPTLSQFEKWLTTSQAASKLGKSRQGVTWMIENRKLRAVKTQLGWLVDPTAVEVAMDKAKR